ncbi:alpha/beta hydrolase [Calidifontibacter terrae]
MVAAGAATALGIATERLVRARSTAVALGVADEYDDVPDFETVVISDAVPLHVEIDEPRGPKVGGRPTVILTHGYTQNHGVWHFQRQVLRDAGYRVVLWDQRGHGLSERGEPTSYTIAQLGSDLHEVIAQEVPEGPLLLIGHSMGGMAIMALAEQFPELIAERVVGIGLLCTTAGGLSTHDFGFGKQIGAVVHRVGPTAMNGLGTRQKLVDLALRAGRDVESFFVHRYSFGSDVPLSLVRYTGDMIFATPMSVISAFLPTLLDHERVEVLQQFDGIETLVLHGDRDMIVPVAHAAEMIDHMPHAEYVVVRGAGHMLPMEYPEIVNTQVVELAERASRAIEEPDRPRRPRVVRRVVDVGARVRAESARSGKDRS